MEEFDKLKDMHQDPFDNYENDSKDILDDKKPRNIRVTDFEYVDGNNVKHVGYNMNRRLYNCITEIPNRLKKNFCNIGIISGNGMTRVGKSTLAVQIAYLCSWLIAGGKHDPETDEVIKKPDTVPEVRYFFDITSLSKAITEDKGKYNVYVLDEGDEIAGARTSAKRENRLFRELVIRSAIQNYVLIVCLPDFFSLSKAWACQDSDWLCNTYLRGDRRGYFKLYDRDGKTRLHVYGKKKTGAYRYLLARPKFDGEFPDVFVGNKEAYEKAKKDSLTQIDNTKVKKEPANNRFSFERNTILLKAMEKYNLTPQEAADEFGMSIDKVYKIMERMNVIKTEGGNNDTGK